MTNRFLSRLINAIDTFDWNNKHYITIAEKLSVEIHEAESHGYDTSNREDKYWLELTDKVQEFYQKNQLTK